MLQPQGQLWAIVGTQSHSPDIDQYSFLIQVKINWELRNEVVQNLAKHISGTETRTSQCMYMYIYQGALFSSD